MLGLGDGWVFLAYSANIIVTIICVVYGIVNWNRGSEESLTGEKDGDK